MASTRLSLLLKHLHINAKDLATNIHVDPSLVSRWSTGNRILDVNSNHFINIINYIIENDRLTGYKNIETFLRYYSFDSEFNQDGDIYLALKRWLSAPPLHCLRVKNKTIDNASNFSEVGIYKGRKEKKDALLNFLDTAIYMPAAKNIYIMIGRDTNDCLERKPFYFQWITKLHEIVSQGHHLFFIYDYSFSSFINNLKEFFSLCSSGLYHAYYLPKRGNFTTSFNLCIVEDLFALTDFTPFDDIMNKPVCYSFTDQNIVNSLKILYMNYLKSCHTLNNETNSISQVQMYSYLECRTQEEQDIYIYDEFPFLFPVNKDLVYDILKFNNFSPEDINYSLQCYESILYKPLMENSHCEESVYRIMLNIDMLAEHINDEHFIFPPLLISQKKIIIPKKFYRNYIDEINKFISSENYNSKLEIAIVDNNHMKINTGITFLTKNQLFSLAYPHTEYEKAMLFTNSTIISNTHDYLEEFWSNMPDENTNAINIKARLNKLLSLLQN